MGRQLTLLRCSAALAFVLVAALAVEAIDRPSNTVNICMLQQYSQSSVTGDFHARFALQEFAPRYPGVTFNYETYAVDGNRNFTTAIASLLAMPDSCTFLLGPGTSRFSIAVSPLVSRPWLGATASSTSLSDKEAHKWFSRAIPNDAYGGAGLAALTQHFGWNRVNIICSDEAYGVSLVAGFTTAFAPTGGMIDSASCFPIVSTTADRAAWRSALEHTRSQSASKIIVVAHAEPNDDFVDAVVALGMQHTHVFVLGEICDQRSPNVSLKLPGAVCASYAIGPTAADFTARYAARNTTADRLRVARLGLYDSVNYVASTVYDFMYVDLVIHAMAATHRLFVFNGSRLEATQPDNFVTIMDSFRSTNTSGYTGAMLLNSRGDREGAIMSFVNFQPAGTQAAFATWTATNGTTVTDTRQLYWLASGYSDPPAAVETTTTEIPVIIVIGALCASVILLLLAVMFFKMRSASPEVYAQLIRSGIAVTIGKILAHAVDIGTDIVSCVVVVTRDVGSSTFVIVYVCLTVVAVTASIAEVVVLILQFLDTLHHHGDLSVAQEVEWEKRLARTAVISLIAEDLPMAVIATVAIKEQADVPLLVSLLLSTILFGTKATYIPPLVQSIMRRQSAKKVGMDDGVSSDVLHSATPPIVLDAAAAEIQSEQPDRYEQLRQHAVDAVVLCREQQIDQNEFFAGVWQRTAMLYESGGAAMEDSLKDGEGGEDEEEEEEEEEMDGEAVGLGGDGGLLPAAASSQRGAAEFSDDGFTPRAADGAHTDTGDTVQQQ